MARLIFNLKNHLTRPETLDWVAEGIGISSDQMASLSSGRITSLNRGTLASIITFMRANGHPDFDVSDLLKYEPD